MKQIWGHTNGLKPEQLKRLDKLYKRRVPPQAIISPELARDLALLSREIQRQIGLLIDRKGHIAYVIVGNHQSILIPSLEDYRINPGRLRGVRCVHTHLRDLPIDEDDLTDLALLRLDLMSVVTVTDKGFPHQVHWSHILPGKSGKHPYEVRAALRPHELDIDCLALIQALERELIQ